MESRTSRRKIIDKAPLFFGIGTGATLAAASCIEKNRGNLEYAQMYGMLGVGLFLGGTALGFYTQRIENNAYREAQTSHETPPESQAGQGE